VSTKQNRKKAICQIVVFGVCHDVQGAANWRGRRINDAQYKTVLRRLFRRRDFIFEEATGMGPTTAEILALETFGPAHYLDVDPAIEQRSAFNIAQTGQSHPIDPYDPETDSLNEEFIEPQRTRESLWLSKIREISFKNGLLICGFVHTLSMSFRLQSAGYTVEARFYLPWRGFCRGQESQ
jgi:hypothetical protein